MSLVVRDEPAVSEELVEALWSRGQGAALRIGRSALLAGLAMALCLGQRHVDYSLLTIGFAVFGLATVRPLYPLAIAIVVWLLALFLVTPEMFSQLSVMAIGMRAA